MQKTKENLFHEQLFEICVNFIERAAREMSSSATNSLIMIPTLIMKPKATRGHNIYAKFCAKL